MCALKPGLPLVSMSQAPLVGGAGGVAGILSPPRLKRIAICEQGVTENG